MFDASAPETEVVFDAVAHFGTDGAMGVGNGAALPPLVVELAVPVLGYDVLTLWLSQLSKST